VTGTRKSIAAFVEFLVAAVAALTPAPTLAWGPDGHAIVAEIAERRLGAAAREQVRLLLGAGHSLASESTWADDVRQARPGTFNWHFVNIPRDAPAYDRARDCRDTPRGDCIVEALERARARLACGDIASRRDALRWTVHLVADLHQPLHTIGEAQGGTGIRVDVDLNGLRCPRCASRRSQDTLHGIWDTSLIAATAWSWGAYVSRLEDGWLATSAARDAARGTVVDWVDETHAVAREVWRLTPEDRVIRDGYYFRVLPIVDQQLGRAGLRLGVLLDDAFQRSCMDRAAPR